MIRPRLVLRADGHVRLGLRVLGGREPELARARANDDPVEELDPLVLEEARFAHDLVLGTRDGSALLGGQLRHVEHRHEGTIGAERGRVAPGPRERTNTAHRYGQYAPLCFNGSCF